MGLQFLIHQFIQQNARTALLRTEMSKSMQKGINIQIYINTQKKIYLKFYDYGHKGVSDKELFLKLYHHPGTI